MRRFGEIAFWNRIKLKGRNFGYLLHVCVIFFLLLAIVIQTGYSFISNLSQITLSNTVTSSNGYYVWVSGGGNEVSQIDSITGNVISQITTSVSNPHGLAFTPDGKDLVVANSSSLSSNLLTIMNAGTSSVTVVQNNISGCTTPISVAFAPSDEGYVACQGSANVYSFSINESTGIISAGNSYSVGSNPNKIAVSPSGLIAGVVNTGSTTVSFINLTTGNVQNSASFSPNGNIVDLAFTADSTQAWVVSEGGDDIVPITVSNLSIGTKISMRSNTTPDSIQIYASSAYVGSSTSSSTYPAVTQVDLADGSDKLTNIIWNTNNSSYTGEVATDALAIGGSSDQLFAGEFNTNCSPCSSVGSVSLLGSLNSNMLDITTSLKQITLPVNAIAVSRLVVSESPPPVSLSNVSVTTYPVISSGTSFDTLPVQEGMTLFSQNEPNININPMYAGACSGQPKASNSLTDAVPSTNGQCQNLAIDGNSITASTCITAIFFGNIPYCAAVDSHGDFYGSSTGMDKPIKADPGNSLNAISCVQNVTCYVGDSAGNIITISNINSFVASSYSISETNISSSPIVAISCGIVKDQSSQTDCMTADSSGNVFEMQNKSWSTTNLVDKVTSMSCLPDTNEVSINQLNCMAVDANGYAYSYFYDSALKTYGWYGWNGSGWVADTGQGGWTSVDTESSFTSVSCDTINYNSTNGEMAPNCMAVDARGYAFISIATTGPNAANFWYGWNGSGWITTEPTGGWTAIDPNSWLSSVSCPAVYSSPTTPNYCEVTDSKGNLLYFNALTATSWSVQAIDSPHSILTLSCYSYSPYCIAFDNLGQELTIVPASYSTYPSGPAYGNPVVFDTDGTPTAIACLSTTQCMAVDSNGNALLGTELNNSPSFSWNMTSIDNSNKLTSISCISGICMAVDSAGYAFYYDGTAWEGWNGSGWTTTEPTGGWTAIDSGKNLTSVSCTSATWCMLVDSSGNGVVYNSGSFGTASASGLSTLVSISCVMNGTNEWCVGVGGADNAIYDSSTGSWTTGSIDPNSTLTAVFCSAYQACLAADSSGDGISYDTSGWESLFPIDPGTSITSINCQDFIGFNSSCIVGESSGKISVGQEDTLVTGSPTWNASAVSISPIDINSVSCITLNQCLYIDASGRYGLNNGAGTLPVGQPGSLTPGDGSGEYKNYETIFTSTIKVSIPGIVNLRVDSSGAWILGMGSSPTGAVPTVYPNPTGPGSTTPLKSYPVVAKENALSNSSVTPLQFYFPASGSYPIELDYVPASAPHLVLETSAGLPVPADITTPSCPIGDSMSAYNLPEDGTTAYEVCSPSLNSRFVSFDGTPIDYDVTIPIDGTGTHPLVALFTGGQGNKLNLESTLASGTTNWAGQQTNSIFIGPGMSNAWFAEHGYSTLTWSPRGIAGSCGDRGSSPVSINYSAYSYLIDPNCTPVNSLYCYTSTTSGCIGANSYGQIINDSGIWPSAVASGATGAISQISCYPSPPSFCAAVDVNGEALTTSSPTVQGAWTSNMIDPKNILTTVSCFSSSMCVAADNMGNFFEYNGTAWFEPTNSAGSGPQADTGHVITGISCISASLCLGVDDFGDLIAATFSGTSGTYSINSIDTTTWNAIPLTGISCLSASVCLVADTSGNTIGLSCSSSCSTASSWQQTKTLEDSAGTITSVSCIISGTTCYMVDTSGNLIVGTYSSGWSFNTYAVDPTHSLRSVSCASMSYCAITDETGAILISTNPTNISSWQSTVSMSEPSCASGSNTICTVVTDNGLSITSASSSSSNPQWTYSVSTVSANSDLTSVSCPTDVFCATVDTSGNFYVENGTSWSSISIDSGHSITSVSCAGGNNCSAVDNAGNFLYLVCSSNCSTASNWTSTSINVDGSNVFTSISCAISWVCAATDTKGNIIDFTCPNGQSGCTWTYSLGAGYTNHYLVSISCEYDFVVYCVAVDNAGNEATGSYSPWSWQPAMTEVDTLNGSGVSLDSISCTGQGAASYACVATDSNGGFVSDNAGTWSSPNQVDSASGLSGISCFSMTACFAFDSDPSRGQIYYSSNVFTNTPLWSQSASGYEQSWSHFIDRRFEVRDMQGLIGQLVDDGIAIPNKIVATGVSYGSLQTLGLGFSNDQVLELNGDTSVWRSPLGTPIQVAAIIPYATLTDVFSALEWNGRASDGVIVPSGNTAIPIGSYSKTWVSSIAYSTFSGTQKAPKGSQDDLFSILTALMTGEPYGPDTVFQNNLSNWQNYHSVLYEPVPSVPVPIFAVQGTTDLFLSALQVQMLVNRLQSIDPNYPITAFYLNMGHSNEQSSTIVNQAATAAMNWLNEVMSSDTPSPQVMVNTTTCSDNVNSDIVVAPSLNNLIAQSVEISATSSGIVNSTALISDQNGACSNAQSPKTSTLPLGDLIIGSIDNTTNNPVNLAGGVVITATLAPTGLSETLVAQLWDQNSALGCGTNGGPYNELITASPYRIVGPNPGKVTFETFPDGWTLMPGHCAVVVLSQSSGQWHEDSMPTNIDESLRSVSCISTSLCVATGATGMGYVTTSPTASTPTWTQSIVDPGNIITSVSCVDVTDCYVVDNVGQVFYFNGTNWYGWKSGNFSTQDTGQGGWTSIDSSNDLTSISCPTSTFCMAVDNQGDAIEYSGGSWSVTAVDTTNALSSVSCISSNFCESVDDAGNAYNYTSSGWALSAAIDNQSLVSISCQLISSNDDCLTVDTVGDVFYLDGGTWKGWTASGWADLSSSPILSTTDNSQPSSISCYVSTNLICAISDDVGGVIANTNVNSSSWSVVSPTVDNNAYITSLSCATSSSVFCLAVDNNGNSVSTSSAPLNWNGAQSVTNKALVAESCWNAGSSNNYCETIDTKGKTLFYNGSTWATTDSLNLGSNTFTSLSCQYDGSSTSLCVAGDSGGNVYTNTDPSQHGNWSGAVNISTATLPQINSISCDYVSGSPGNWFCGAVDESGNAFTSTSPTSGSWSKLYIPAPDSNPLDSISCISDTFCGAVDTAGNLITCTTSASCTAKPPTFIASGTISSSGNKLTSISCMSSTLCFVTDANGNIYNGNCTGSPTCTWTWSKPNNVDGSAYISSLSCVNQTYFSVCTLIDANGYILSGIFQQGQWDRFSFSNPYLMDPSIDGSSPYPQVSCISSNFCMFQDNKGNVVFYNGTQFSGTTTISITNAKAIIPEAP